MILGLFTTLIFLILATPWLGLAIPILAPTYWIILRFYLATSKVGRSLQFLIDACSLYRADLAFLYFCSATVRYFPHAFQFSMTYLTLNSPPQSTPRIRIEEPSLYPLQHNRRRLDFDSSFPSERLLRGQEQRLPQRLSGSLLLSVLWNALPSSDSLLDDRVFPLPRSPSFRDSRLTRSLSFLFRLFSRSDSPSSLSLLDLPHPPLFLESLFHSSLVSVKL